MPSAIESRTPPTIDDRAIAFGDRPVSTLYRRSPFAHLWFDCTWNRPFGACGIKRRMGTGEARRRVANAIGTTPGIGLKDSAEDPPERTHRITRHADLSVAPTLPAQTHRYRSRTSRYAVAGGTTGHGSAIHLATPRA